MRTNLSSSSDLPLLGAITFIIVLAGQNPRCTSETTPTISNTASQPHSSLAIREETINAQKAQVRLILQNVLGEVKP